jgi:hypothetical protein
MSEENVTTAGSGASAVASESAPAASAPSSASTAASTGAAVASGPTGGDAAGAAPAWTPDWSYDFNGKKKEIDPFFRSLATDPDTLKKIKDYVQRADATELHRETAKKYSEQIKQFEPEMQTLGKLRDQYNAGNHERVLSDLGYTDEMIFEIAKQKLDRLRDPNAKQAYEQKTQADLAQEQLLADNQRYRSQAEEHLAKVTQWELDRELGKAEVHPIQEAYDKAYGSGAFKSLVISRGSTMVERAGRHIEPRELVELVSKEFAPFIQTQPQAGTPIELSQSTQPTQPPGSAKPKVIPVVKGSGAPTKGAVRSLDDLRKLARSQ